MPIADVQLQSPELGYMYKEWVGISTNLGKLSGFDSLREHHTIKEG